MSQIRVFLSLVLLLGVVFLPFSAQAATYTCTSGTSVFGGVASGDTVIATDSCTAVTVNCTSNNQCTNMLVYAASTDITINCTRRDTCNGANLSIGIPDTVPSGYTESDFDGVVNSFTLNCGSNEAYNRRESCQNMTLKVFEDVQNQDLNCIGYRSCIGLDATLYNSFTGPSGTGGAIDLFCGTNDVLQCDTADFIIESAGAPYACTGVTCNYIGCTTPGCTTPTDPPPENNDPDGDGVSNHYDGDDDGDGLPDEIDNDPNASDPDPDGDNIDNTTELTNGTDPFNVQDSNVETELRLSPRYYRYGSEEINAANCTASSTPKTYTITNKGATDKTLNSIPTLSGAYAGEFEVFNNTCSSGLVLAANASCTFDAVFCPTSDGNKSALITINTDDAETPVLTAALFSFESNLDVAERRVPAVLRTITVAPKAGGAAITDGVLSSGVEYTFTMTLDGYSNNYQVFSAIFACPVDDTTRCGKYYSENRVGQFGPLSATVSNLEGGGVSYGGVNSNLFTFSFDFTPTTTGNYVLRFYRKNATDLSLGKRSISLIVPGGGVGLPSYATDVGGRRLSFTVQ